MSEHPSVGYSQIKNFSQQRFALSLKSQENLEEFKKSTNTFNECLTTSEGLVGTTFLNNKNNLRGRVSVKKSD